MGQALMPFSMACIAFEAVTSERHLLSYEVGQNSDTADGMATALADEEAETNSQERVAGDVDVPIGIG